jgi:hypothetical protein
VNQTVLKKESIGISESLYAIFRISNLEFFRGVNKECKILPIIGKPDENGNFIPHDSSLMMKVGDFDIFILFDIGLAEDNYSVYGWSDNDFNLSLMDSRNGLIISSTCISKKLDLLRERLINWSPALVYHGID